MKTEKGVTLISLTIYIIGMTIVIAVISVVSGYFYKNYNTTSKKIDYVTEYTRFNSFFADEANHSNIKVLDYDIDYIVFDNGVQYTYIPENRGVYRNKVKICNEVENCTFNYEIKNGKAVVKVSLQINSKTKETTYTLKN